MGELISGCDQTFHVTQTAQKKAPNLYIIS